ncbi:MAG: hypothetical protein M3P49_12660 [Actinomycetota bacterium]|nr:hypothetical protein [Actinomycetota bacterium]
MTRRFTHYWTNETWKRERRLQQAGRAGDRLEHIASNQFAKRGVESGDGVYPVTVFDGALYLLGRLEVDKVCDVCEAARHLKKATTDLYEADDHIIAAQSTYKHFDLGVPTGLAEQLTFVGGGVTKRLKFDLPGHLNRQTLRGVRELHPQSAAELDKLLSSVR